MGLEPSARVGIRVVAVDQGPGIRNLEDILDGNYRSKTGMGLGIRGSRNIMDAFKIKTTPGKGTRIEMVKYRF
jgi:serine/threonine-protein kinase RsbT